VIDLFPDTARIDGDHLEIGGCTLSELAAEYGTPLYVFDEASIRSRARGYLTALAEGYPGPATVCYAAKAYGVPWVLRLMAEEGLGLDVVSGGELFAAVRADFPRDRIYFHGNNKGEDELHFALEEGVGRIVVDHLEEIALLGRLAVDRGIRQPILLRVSPGVDARTHAHLHTGGLDTKFGLGITSGKAAEGVKAILSEAALELRGFHAHIGSQITEIEPYAAAVDRVLGFVAQIQDECGFELGEISTGGGFAVRYTLDDPPVDAFAMAKEVGQKLARGLESMNGLTSPPRLTIEPGRSIVAQAASALYRVGSVKANGEGRTYVAVDGGMADNIRPTAYGAQYTAVLADRMRDPADLEVALAGKYCETGDILIQGIRLPRPRVGDLVAMPMAGAYQLAMASNYNMALRPAVVVVANGSVRLVRRRETYADLLAAEVVDVEPAWEAR
jgi:diaminopimelate decarboxylase